MLEYVDAMWMRFVKLVTPRFLFDFRQCFTGKTDESVDLKLKHRKSGFYFSPQLPKIILN